MSSFAINMANVNQCTIPKFVTSQSEVLPTVVIFCNVINQNNYNLILPNLWPNITSMLATYLMNTFLDYLLWWHIILVWFTMGIKYESLDRPKVYQKGKVQ